MPFAGASLYAGSIVNVVHIGTPFQILHAVISLVFILMVYLWQSFRVGKESLCHKAVDSKVPLFAILISKTYAKVSAMIYLWNHYTACLNCPEGSMLVVRDYFAV